ncbi:hypothetical protein B9Z19DRAFT_1065473 [Tuber borchii]|uniref:Uncharacterized protein n=1 Tax=Tuber borchii TaxID=42251 RepID=A0A2T6ZR42_TUBBO|nr:hypothetical protein B9Z19DRAFT_1065473 [Tuber borchii]
MSYLVMPEDLLPGGDSLVPSPPRKEGKSPKLEKGHPVVALPPRATVSPYIPVAPPNIRSSNISMLSRKKGKKCLVLPFASSEEVATRDYDELPCYAEQPKKEKEENERHAVVLGVQEQAMEPSTCKNEFNCRRVSAPVTIRNPADMPEVELAKLVGPTTTKYQHALRAKKVGEKRVGSVEKQQATSALEEPTIAPSLEVTVPVEEYFSALPLALKRAEDFDGEREKVSGAGVESSSETPFHGGSSSWEARVSRVTTSPAARKHENRIPDKEFFSFNRVEKTMPVSNRSGPIRRLQAEPADPAKPIPSIARRLAALEDAFRKLTASTNMDSKLREDFQNVTRDFRNKTLAEMTALGANFQTLQNATTSIMHRQDMVEDAMVNHMQRFEEDLLEDTAVSGRIINRFRELRNDTSDCFGELRKLREEVGALLDESTQCRFKAESILNGDFYVAKARKLGAIDK